MSYLTEAFQFIVPNYYFHTNNAYMVIGDDFEVDKISNEKKNEPTIKCKSHTSNNFLISPMVSINNFPQLPNMNSLDDFYRQRGRGHNEPIYTTNSAHKFCNKMNSCGHNRLKN